MDPGGDRRLVRALVAVAGAMFAHAIAYALWNEGTGVSGHGRTDTVFSLIVPAVLAVFGFVTARAAVHAREVGALRVGALTAAQGAVFVTQELVEGIGAGGALVDVVTARTFLVGLALQPLVAAVLVHLLRRAERLGSVLGFPGAGLVACTPLLRWRPLLATPPAPLVSTGGHGSRAPPR